MTFKEVYRPPFTTDGVFVYGQGNVVALMPGDTDCPYEILERACHVLNGVVPSKGNRKIGCDGPEIYLNGDLFLVVRGWGYLTGVGGLNLPHDEAARIQDDFARWVAGRLRGDDAMANS